MFLTGSGLWAKAKVVGTYLTFDANEVCTCQIIPPSELLRPTIIILLVRCGELAAMQVLTLGDRG